PYTRGETLARIVLPRAAYSSAKSHFLQRVTSFSISAFRANPILQASFGTNLLFFSTAQKTRVNVIPGLKKPSWRCSTLSALNLISPSPAHSSLRRSNGSRFQPDRGVCAKNLSRDKNLAR